MLANNFNNPYFSSEQNHAWFDSSFDDIHFASKEKLEMRDGDNSRSHSPRGKPQVQVSNKRIRSNNGKGIGCGGGESVHEMHILTERERRKKMRNMFSNLHALLPHLPAKADKSTIVDEAVKYIKTLQQTLQALQKQRLEKLQSATAVDYEQSIITSSKVTALGSRESYLADQGQPPKNLSMPTTKPHSFQVPNSPACFQTWFSPNVMVNTCGDDAQISLCSPRKTGLLATILCILEKHNLDLVSANISSDNYRSLYMIHAHASRAHQFPEAISVEEIFKLAVGEMNLWLLTS